jgi:hypothetical protein
VRRNKAYAIETGADGGKTVHSFTSHQQRDSWVQDSPTSRAEVLGNSKTVASAIYTETIVTHQEAR